MSQETEALLKAILFQLKMSESIPQAIIAVETMCSKETVAYVNEQVTKAKENL